MKIILSMRENLDLLFEHIVKDYSGEEISKEIRVNFKLKDNNNTYLYALKTNGNILELLNSELDNPNLTVESEANEWLKICSNRANPILSAIMGKVTFKGDTKALSILTSKKNSGEYKNIVDPPQDYEKNRKSGWKNLKKVLLISGSPRGDRGYTHLLLEKFAEGVREAGAEANIVTLKDKNIKLCSGCWSCWTVTNGECVINDDMRELKKQILDADLIVYGFPIYVDGLPAILKNVLDRQIQLVYPYFVDGIYKTRHPKRAPKEQYLTVLSDCGFSEVETFRPMREHFKEIAHNQHLKVLDFILFPEASYIFNNPTMYDFLIKKIDLIKNAGKDLINSGKVDKKSLKYISKSSVKKSKINEWRVLSNRFWENKIEEKDTDY